MPKFAEIKAFTETAYNVDVPFDYIKLHLQRWDKYGLQLDPDFQRAHVWTEEQQIKFVEYALRGGVSGRDFYFNHPHELGFGLPIQADTPEQQLPE